MTPLCDLCAITGDTLPGEPLREHLSKSTFNIKKKSLSSVLLINAKKHQVVCSWIEGEKLRGKVSVLAEAAPDE